MHLLTPTQLKRELQIIYGQMPSELTLPITNIETDLQYIYKLLKVKARATLKYVIIEITFPLISRESFQLYKIIPVPHQTNNNMATITPVSEYVAVNLKKDSYFSINIYELSACLQHGTGYMCQLLKPILDLKNDESFCETNSSTNECKIQRSTCTNRWVELHLTSQHLYFCCGTYTIKIICGDQITIHQLSQAGVIGMSQECVIKGKDFSLYSIRHQSNQIDLTPSIYVPEFDQLNHIVNIKIPDEGSTDDGNLNASMTSLGEAIEKLKASDAEVDDISPHDIHHYVISYVLAAGALCAAAAWAWKSKRCCLHQGAVPARRGEGRRRQRSAATPPPPRPQPRRESHRRQESVMAPPPLRSTSEPDHSEVLSASELNNKSDISFRLHNYAKRWPSANYSAVKRGKKTDPGVPNDNMALENSIV
ncbi:Iris-A [Operophtera brumata]|uniref:Iris-A n=1 Tax=Operophtera brumata TaxID=104452 RepID=A0A0L7KWR8_OPEBR|nr:Iris-A [Operophtera brumata]